MIPVCVPTLGEAEREYVLECLETNWISARGDFVTEFEDGFSSYCGVEHGITTTSGTTALHLALRAIGIGEGDEVIIPTFTIGSTAFAVRYCGATPVPVDATPETWNIDTEKIARHITPDTKAIMPVHTYGHPCDMDPILEVASEHDLYVIEDAAEAHGSEYRGRKAGNLGHIACFSFYANKLITTGEGGMVITDDDEIAERARYLKDLAYSADRRYVHDDIGYNYRMTNVQAAIGVGQLEQIDDLLSMRRENARRYTDRLASVAGIRTPPEEPWATNSYWMYAILVDPDVFGTDRDGLMWTLDESGIGTRPFFVPMHQQPVFEGTEVTTGDFPVADDIADRGLYLPSTSHLQPETIDEICDVIERVAD